MGTAKMEDEEEEEEMPWTRTPMQEVVMVVMVLYR